MKFATYEENLEYVKTHLISCSTAEAETIITYTRVDAKANIDTSDNTVVTKCLKHCAKNPAEWRLVDYTWLAGDEEHLSSVVFECPKRLVSLRQASLVLSEEECQMRAANLKNTRGQTR